jgi:hypothetical protein
MNRITSTINEYIKYYRLKLEPEALHTSNDMKMKEFQKFKDCLLNRQL